MLPVSNGLAGHPRCDSAAHRPRSAGAVGRLSCNPEPPTLVMVSIFAITSTANPVSSFCVEGLTTPIAAILELSTLVLSVIGIRRVSQHRESALGRLLMAQGVIYFVMVFFLQMIMVVSGSAPRTCPSLTLGPKDYEIRQPRWWVVVVWCHYPTD